MKRRRENLEKRKHFRREWKSHQMNIYRKCSILSIKTTLNDLKILQKTYFSKSWRNPFHVNASKERQLNNVFFSHIFCKNDFISFPCSSLDRNWLQLADYYNYEIILKKIQLQNVGCISVCKMCNFFILQMFC